jgi:hypothetical protein
MTNNFEKILQNKFSNHKVVPPDYIFNEVKKHYPKKSFLDIISNPKSLSLIISGVIIIGVVSVLIFNNTVIKNPKYQPETFQEKSFVTNNKSNAKTEELFNQSDNTNNTVQNQQSGQNKEPELVKKSTNIFSINDTMICGNTLVLNSNIDINSLSTDCDLNISKNSQGDIIVCCTDNGKCKLYYASTIENTIYCDTMSISFNNTTKPELEIVREINCPNEPLLIKLATESGNNISWDIPGAEIRELSNEYYNIKWNDYNGDTAIIKVRIEQKGCVHTIESKTFLPSAPNITISKYPELCKSKNASISVSSDEKDIINYSLNNIVSENGKFTNLEAGNYNLKISYNNNCVYTEPIEINSAGIIDVDFDIEYDAIDKQRVQLINKTKIDNEDFFNASDVYFEWQIGNKVSYETNPIFMIENDADQAVSLTIKYGEDCSETVVKTLNFTEDYIMAPNIFTPDGDGISDKFIVKIGATSSFEAVITNTRGEIIYRWVDPYDGWDGRINGGNIASEGVYYYIIKAVKPDGSIVEKKGMLQLVRN